MTTSVRSRPVPPDDMPVRKHLFTPLDRLNEDLRRASTTLTPGEVRYYVGRYYQMQDQRKAAGNQLLASSKAGEPNNLLVFDLQQSRKHEDIIKSAMQLYAESRQDGRWLLSQYGVGPVISSGILTHIDITKAPTVGHIWNFAGQNAQIKWLSREEANAWVKAHSPVSEETVVLAAEELGRRADTLLRDATFDKKHPGETKKLTATGLAAALARCPWNRHLKTLCWKAADCFKKFSNRNEHDNLYGALYKAYKLVAIRKNLGGEFAQLAAATLATRNIQETATRRKYEAGQFPDGRVDLWAMRAVIKIFLSHVHHVLYEVQFGTQPPTPYILAHDPRHTHYIPPPHWPFKEGTYAVANDNDEDEP